MMRLCPHSYNVMMRLPLWCLNVQPPPGLPEVSIIRGPRLRFDCHSTVHSPAPAMGTERPRTKPHEAHTLSIRGRVRFGVLS